MSSALWRLIVVQGLMNASHFMAMPIIGLYCLKELSYSEFDVSITLTTYFLFARVAPLVVAPVVDRFGKWEGVTLGLVLRGCGFLIFTVRPTAEVSWLAASVLGLGTSIYEAGAYGVIGAQPSQIRRSLIILNTQGLNIGVIVGPLAGAALSLLGLWWPIAVSGVLFILLSIAVTFETAPEVRHFEKPESFGSTKAAYSDRDHLLFCLAMIPWFVLFAQLFSSIPIEAVRRGGSDTWASLVLVVKGIVGVVGLFATPAIVRRFGRRAAMNVYIIAGAWVFTLVPLTTGPEAILFVVGVYSLAEVGALTLSESLIADRATGDNSASYFALFFVSWGIGGAIGGAIGPYLSLEHGSSPGWYIIALSCSLTV